MVLVLLSKTSDKWTVLYSSRSLTNIHGCAHKGKHEEEAHHTQRSHSQINHSCSSLSVGVVPNSLQDIGRASDGAKRRPVAGGLGRSVRYGIYTQRTVYTPLLGFRGDLILL